MPHAAWQSTQMHRADPAASLLGSHRWLPLPGGEQHLNLLCHHSRPHFLGLTSQNYSVGQRCLRRTELLSALCSPLSPSCLFISLPGSHFASILVGQMLPSSTGIAETLSRLSSVWSNHNFLTSWRNPPPLFSPSPLLPWRQCPGPPRQGLHTWFLHHQLVTDFWCAALNRKHFSSLAIV